MDNDRLIDIETKIAFQEQTIKELNDVVYEQQNQIDKLSATCDALVKRIMEMADTGMGSDAPANERPPHY